jgi:geranylgeranyl pyrophosphate synthase
VAGPLAARDSAAQDRAARESPVFPAQAQRRADGSGAAFGDGSARPELGELIRYLEGVYPQADGLDALMRYALLPPGKLLRPWLVLECVAALGGDSHAAVPGAVAVEMLHAATLVHDDILDGDLVRRGRPAVARRYGAADALVGGDAMICSALGQLASLQNRGVPADRVVTALRVLSEAGVEVCRGQLLEAAMTGRLDCGLGEYVRMVRLKTGALLAAATRIAAAVAGAGDAATRALTDFGENLGVAYQMQDDLLPLLSRAGATGKPAASDLRNRRPTLPVLLAYRDGGPAARVALRELWDLPPELALDAMTELVTACGALESARVLTADYAARARRALDELPPGKHRDRLAMLAEHVVARTQ